MNVHEIHFFLSLQLIDKMSEVILEKARKRYEYHTLYHIEARDLLNEVMLELNKQSISNIHFSCTFVEAVPVLMVTNRFLGLFCDYTRSMMNVRYQRYGTNLKRRMASCVLPCNKSTINSQKQENLY